jgi:Ca2+-binding RTX toxin-like protein
VTTEVGRSVTFSVDCTDTGPEYERSPVRFYADTQPTAGTLVQEFAGDPFTYQPNPGFTGSDQFEVNSFDDLGFGTERATVSITVLEPPRCAGRASTIVGTPGRDRIQGGPGRDVISGLAGNDVIHGLRGNDLICGGPGRDRISGGPGRDRLLGNRGNDILKGGRGADRLLGGPQRDRLFGGPGRDFCNGGQGRDRSSGCERRVAVP